MNSSSQQWSADAARASGSPRLVAARGLAVLADRLASLCFSLSLSLCLFWTTTCETRFFVWVSFVFDCLVAHVKTKCPTQHAIPTRSREKTEPNPKKPFSYLFALLSYTQLRRETLLFLKIEQTFSVRVLIPSCPAPPVPRRPNEFSANISLDFFATRDVVGVAWRESAERAAE